MKNILTFIAKRSVTATILIACIGLMQFHSWNFWDSFAGGEIGRFWSVTIELTAVWLWSTRKFGASVIAAIASLTVLASSLFSLTEPVLDQWNGTQSQSATLPALIELSQTRIASLEDLQADNKAKSLVRSGWLKSIQETQASLDAEYANLATLLATNSTATTKTTNNLQTWIGLGLQVASLLVMQVAIVFASRSTFAAIPAGLFAAKPVAKKAKRAPRTTPPKPRAKKKVIIKEEIKEDVKPVITPDQNVLDFSNYQPETKKAVKAKVKAKAPKVDDTQLDMFAM